jgi:hypothetical protein
MAKQIRRDDLEALGEMAGLVGTYMTDFAQKSDADARSKLFKHRLDPRATMKKALEEDENDLARAIIPDGCIPVDAPLQTPQPVLENTPRPEGPNINQHSPEVIRPRTPQSNQLEFEFIEQKIEGFGTVGDVVKHFNDRLDKIEETFKLIKSFMVEIRKSSLQHDTGPR